MADLRIMTFNIRGAHFGDGVNEWHNRLDLNVRTILKYAPDLIGFQEVHLKNMEDYRAHLSGYQFELGPPYNDEEPFQYPAIAWKPDRLRRVEGGGFWLSQTPEVHSASWDTRCIRSASWVRLEWLENSSSFVHLNTHLDHISEEARVEGTRLILRQMGEICAPGTPQVVTGDFNCLPGSVPYQLFQEAGFVDAYLAAGHFSPMMTYHGFQDRAVVESLTGFDRIDWILLRNWHPVLRVKDSYRAEDAEPPVYPSDHYPVVADLRSIRQKPAAGDPLLLDPHSLLPHPDWLVERGAPLKGHDIEDLRVAVGWDRMEGSYDRILRNSYTHFSAHAGDQLVGFVDVISDGIADAFLVDLMVHPAYQRQGLGQSLVGSAIKSLKADGIRVIQVVFEPELEPFYRASGFHILSAGIIDTWNEPVS